jgi:hypothetical protein
MMTATMIFAPIFEADLPDEQYGYRPGRNAHTAVKEVRSLLDTGAPRAIGCDAGTPRSPSRQAGPPRVAFCPEVAEATQGQALHEHS